MTTTYTVRGRDEETFCTWCGEPLEHGDKVFTDDIDVVSFTACSKVCADKVARNHRIFIGRPTMLPTGEQEAHLRCTCGWRDKTFASNVKLLAMTHRDIAHRGAADVQPDPS